MSKVYLSSSNPLKHTYFEIKLTFFDVRRDEIS